MSINFIWVWLVYVHAFMTTYVIYYLCICYIKSQLHRFCFQPAVFLQGRRKHKMSENHQLKSAFKRGYASSQEGIQNWYSTKMCFFHFSGEGNAFFLFVVQFGKIEFPYFKVYPITCMALVGWRLRKDKFDSNYICSLSRLPRSWKLHPFNLVCHHPRFFTKVTFHAGFFYRNLGREMGWKASWFGPKILRLARPLVIQAFERHPAVPIGCFCIFRFQARHWAPAQIECTESSHPRHPP